MKTLLFFPLRMKRAMLCIILFFTLQHCGSQVTILSPVTFYGMTEFGGKSGIGNIFNYNPTTSVFTDLVDFTGDTGSCIGRLPPRSLIHAFDGYLYGMTYTGGKLRNGSIFKYNPITSVFTDLVDFTGDTGSYNGYNPMGNLIQASDSNLYGMTFEGGASNNGNIFKYNPTTRVFTDLVDFTGMKGLYPGEGPYGSLMQAYDGNLYGMTALGGGAGAGVIFKYNPITGVYSDLVNFTGTSGSYIGGFPDGKLIQASDSNLYGMTYSGGMSGHGNIFKYNPTLGLYEDLVDFTGNTGPYMGDLPQGDLIQASDSNLYGMTNSGGTLSNGNIFKYNPATGVFTDLIDFTGRTGLYIGANPFGDLVQTPDGNLYGMTFAGGASGNGNIFKYNPVSAVYTDLVDFTGKSGSYIGSGPPGSLSEYIDKTSGIFNPGKGINNVTLYPNPASKLVYAQLNEFAGKVTFTLYDISGMVLSFQTVENKSLYSINVSSLTPGIYILKIQEGNGAQVMKKITVER